MSHIEHTRFIGKNTLPTFYTEAGTTPELLLAQLVRERTEVALHIAIKV